jgi:hypothetical protein
MPPNSTTISSLHPHNQSPPSIGIALCLRPHHQLPPSTGTLPQPYARTNCQLSLGWDHASTMWSREPPPPPSTGIPIQLCGASQGVDARVSQDTATGRAGKRWPPTAMDWIRRGCAAWAMNPWPHPWCALCCHAPMVAPPSPAHLLLNVSEKLASIPPQPFLSSSFVWLVIPHVIEY